MALTLSSSLICPGKMALYILTSFKPSKVVLQCFASTDFEHIH